ncbi:CobW family GTP-binding protein [Halomarina oriensis]|uniref:GTP-binding protein n=1 Tax=Halomarina oriensis TaxID=671145 RepID=A0A6B0GL67_9EURY|nr:GTP-binding protein [Halomarina oriensis]MWG34467.1 GTP-binding protein [Halomarina oriensis]
MSQSGGTPVTVLSGALGAGKTTTLDHLLTNADRRLAVLVNDMGEVNIDAELVANRDGNVTELSNGCICCDLRDDLEVEVSRLAREREFDHLVVESSGISEPAPVASLFTTGAASAPYELDTLVTVVDTSTFRETVEGSETVEADAVARDRPGRVDRESETRPLGELLVAQVETADVVLLNKCDLAGADEVDAVADLVASLNPRAHLVRAEHGQVDPAELLDSGRFDLDTVSETDAWTHAVEHAEGDGDHHHDPATEYGVESFVVRARRPLDPEAFAAFLREFPDGVIRSKGIVWLAGEADRSYHVEQAGPSRRVEVHGQWIAGLEPSRQEMQRRMHPDLDWDDEVGDRRVELVFIGKGMDEAAIREHIESCLVDRETSVEPHEFPTEADETFVV